MSMQLDPLYIQVLPQLTQTGSSELAQGTMPLDSINVGFRDFAVHAGIDYDISLLNTSEAILLSGTATARISTNCDRCLEPVELVLKGETEGYYLLDPKEAPEDEKLEDYERVDPEGRIDVAPPILAAIVFELPSVSLCKPDCAGIALAVDSSGGDSSAGGSSAAAGGAGDGSAGDGGTGDGGAADGGLPRGKGFEPSANPENRLDDGLGTDARKPSPFDALKDYKFED